MNPAFNYLNLGQICVQFKCRPENHFEKRQGGAPRLFQGSFFQRGKGQRGGAVGSQRSLEDDPLVPGIFLLQGTQRILRAAFVQTGISEAAPSAGIHDLGHQQRWGILRLSNIPE